MIQTLALLLDAYRELNSKKLFWITLAISAVVVTAFAAVGIDDQSMKFFAWHVPIPGINSRTFPPAMFYKTAFAKWGISIWLAWLASILALISTAGILPDFIAGGSIELTLSKPIGRLRLFLTKYATGLLFVVLQVGVFTAASFLVIGVRGGAWDTQLFWAVPLVVCFFSYLFCICVLLGVITRSTIASLLLTLLIWAVLWGINTTDKVLMAGREATAMQVDRQTKKIEKFEAAAAKIIAKKTQETAAATPDSPETPRPDPNTPATPPTQAELDAANIFLPPARIRLEDARKWNTRLTWWSNVAYRVKTFLPKTDETIDLVRRKLVSESDISQSLTEEEQGEVQIGVNDETPVDPRELGMRMERGRRSRSALWIVGTSLGFEGVLLAIAAWLFCRRDF